MLNYKQEKRVNTYYHRVIQTVAHNCVSGCNMVEKAFGEKSSISDFIRAYNHDIGNVTKRTDREVKHAALLETDNKSYAKLYATDEKYEKKKDFLLCSITTVKEADNE